MSFRAFFRFFPTRPLLAGLMLSAFAGLSVAPSPVAAQWDWGGGWGGGGWGGGWGDPDPEPEPEPEPVEPTGITHVIYLIGSDFFPEEVHAQLGDTLMFVNLTNSNQLIEANDGSWASGTLGYHNTYPIMLDHETDWDFTGTTYSYSYWGTYETTFDGRALDTPHDSETDPKDYPYVATSLAERFNITEAVRRIETTRQHVYTVDTQGNILNGAPGG